LLTVVNGILLVQLHSVDIIQQGDGKHRIKMTGSGEETSMHAGFFARSCRFSSPAICSLIAQSSTFRHPPLTRPLNIQCVPLTD